MWRLILSQVATLAELDSSWSLDDLIRGNMALSFNIAAMVGGSK